jgi:hypothetical protein
MKPPLQDCTLTGAMTQVGGVWCAITVTVAQDGVLVLLTSATFKQTENEVPMVTLAPTV